MKMEVRRVWRWLFVPLWLCLYSCVFSTASARAAAPPHATSAPRYRISLLTISPGSELEERLGHSAIAVEDRKTGSELAYNFGTFGDTEAVIEKFLHKRLKFWVAAYNPGEIALRYRQREIRAQELALSDAQAEQLATYLAVRTRPENRDFEYDLFTANCVTPIRNAIDTALDGALHRHTQTPSPYTFRQVLMRGFATMPLLGGFTALIYGPYVDAPRNRWEMMFLPDVLHDTIAELRLSDAPDAPRLVAREKKWRGDAYEELLPLPNPWFIAAGLFTVLLVACVQLFRPDKRVVTGRFLAFFAACLAAAFGVFGVAVYYLDFMPHPSVQQNANRFLFNPLELVAVPLLLMLSVGRLGPRGVRLLLLVIGGTTLIAGLHAILGHGFSLCRQLHQPVVAWALVGRAVLLGCVLLSLRAQKGRSPMTLPAGR